jgi:hypothetical protein
MDLRQTRADFLSRLKIDSMTNADAKVDEARVQAKLLAEDLSAQRIQLFLEQDKVNSLARIYAIILWLVQWIFVCIETGRSTRTISHQITWTIPRT